MVPARAAADLREFLCLTRDLVPTRSHSRLHRPSASIGRGAYRRRTPSHEYPTSTPSPHASTTRPPSLTLHAVHARRDQGRRRAPSGTPRGRTTTARTRSTGIVSSCSSCFDGCLFSIFLPVAYFCLGFWGGGAFLLRSARARLVSLACSFDAAAVNSASMMGGYWRRGRRRGFWWWRRRFSPTTLRFGICGFGFGWLRGRVVCTWRTSALPDLEPGRGPLDGLREAVDARVYGCIELLDGGRCGVEALPQLREAVVDGRGL